MKQNRLVVSLGQICQEIKSENLISPMVAVFFKIDFKVGYPQISL